MLLGTFISTVNTRLSTFGLADIRGAVHAGFDDGAWITTAQTVAQMLVAPIAIGMGGVYGSRRNDAEPFPPWPPRTTMRAESTN